MILKNTLVFVISSLMLMLLDLLPLKIKSLIEKILVTFNKLKEEINNNL